MFGFVGNILGLDVRFKGVGFKFGLVGASGNGTFGEVEVHVSPFGEFLELSYLRLDMLNFIRNNG